MYTAKGVRPTRIRLFLGSWEEASPGLVIKRSQKRP